MEVLKLDDARQFHTQVMCEHVIRSRSKHWPGPRKVGFLLHFALMGVTTAQSCDCQRAVKALRASFTA